MTGAMNTYLRAGKLFPGPHLYAGAAITGKLITTAAPTTLTTAAVTHY